MKKPSRGTEAKRLDRTQPRLELMKSNLRSIREEIALGMDLDPKLCQEMEDGIAEITLAERRRQRSSKK